MPGDDEAIAAVVARPGQHEHARSTPRQHVAGDRSGGQSSALHQRLVGDAGLDGANIRDATDGLGSHRLIISIGEASG